MSSSSSYFFLLSTFWHQGRFERLKGSFFFFFSPTVSCTPAPPPTGWSAKRLLKKGYPICRQAAAGAPADAYTNQRTNTSWLDVDNDFGGSRLFQVGIILRACLRVYLRGIHLGPNYSMPCLTNQKNIFKCVQHLRMNAVTRYSRTCFGRVNVLLHLCRLAGSISIFFVCSLEL